jgi:hypothetical protein
MSDDLARRLSDLRTQHDEDAYRHLDRYLRFEKARKFDKSDQAYAEHKQSLALAEAHKHALMLLRGEITPTFYDERIGERRSMAELPAWQQARADGQALLDRLRDG